MSDREDELRQALIAALMIGHEDPSAVLVYRTPSQELRSRADKLDRDLAERERLWAIARRTQ